MSDHTPEPLVARLDVAAWETWAHFDTPEAPCPVQYGSGGAFLTEAQVTEGVLRGEISVCCACEDALPPIHRVLMAEAANA
jgi:hypothetical protein